jgi:hypothetical protein
MMTTITDPISYPPESLIIDDGSQLLCFGTPYFMYFIITKVYPILYPNHPLLTMGHNCSALGPPYFDYGYVGDCLDYSEQSRFVFNIGLIIIGVLLFLKIRYN